MLLSAPANAMLVLDATTDNIQAVLGGSVTTNQMQCMSSWRDITTTAYTPGKTITNTNNTTDVNVVPAPGSNTQRVVDFLSIYNKDTVSQTLTLKFDANGTEYILYSGTLNTGERLEYSAAGFNTYTSTGGVKSQSTTGMVTSTTENIVLLGGDVVNNNVTPNTIQDVTALSFAVTSGHMYWFKFSIPYTSAATTTGSLWTINGPVAPTLLSYRSTYSLAATTQTQNSAEAYDIPVASNATTSPVGSGIATIEGFINPSADGTVIARFASEITASAITAKAGAIVRWRQLT